MIPRFVLMAALAALTLAPLGCDGGRLDPADWPDTPPNVGPPDGTTADVFADTALDTAGDADSLGETTEDALAEVTPDISGPDADAQAEVDAVVECTPTREFWETELWDKFLGSQCVNCHIEGGIGGGTQFVLDTAGTDAALDANYDVTVAVAMLTSGANRLLTDKPTNQLPHGGGPQLTAGSPEHQALIDFVDRVLNPVSCDP